MYVMPTEQKDLLLKWIAALESGRYKQTKNYLQTEEGFCCLGVLCNEVDPSQWSSWWEENNGIRFKRYDAHGDVLPNQVTVLLPFIPDVSGTEGSWSLLMVMNDNGGKTFKEIAEYLRETYLQG